jgi:hypothetical protein
MCSLPVMFGGGIMMQYATGAAPADGVDEAALISQTK